MRKPSGPELCQTHDYNILLHIRDITPTNVPPDPHILRRHDAAAAVLKSFSVYAGGVNVHLRVVRNVVIIAEPGGNQIVVRYNAPRESRFKKYKKQKNKTTRHRSPETDRRTHFPPGKITKTELSMRANVSLAVLRGDGNGQNY